MAHRTPLSGVPAPWTKSTNRIRRVTTRRDSFPAVELRMADIDGPSSARTSDRSSYASLSALTDGREQAPTRSRPTQQTLGSSSSHRQRTRIRCDRQVSWYSARRNRGCCRGSSEATKALPENSQVGSCFGQIALAARIPYSRQPLTTTPGSSPQAPPPSRRSH